jgi:hypothetical protein
METYIHVVERAFVKGAFSLLLNLETMGSVPFAIPTEVEKQTKKELKN